MSGSNRSIGRAAITTFALIFLLNALTLGAPSPTPSPHRRPRISDFEPPKRRSILQSIENALPLWLAIFLGLRADNVRIEGTAGSVSVSAGSSDRGK